MMECSTYWSLIKHTCTFASNLSTIRGITLKSYRKLSKFDLSLLYGSNIMYFLFSKHTLSDIICKHYMLSYIISYFYFFIFFGKFMIFKVLPFLDNAQNYVIFFILTYARHLWSLSSEGSLAGHNYCDTGHPFMMVISEDPRNSHLLPRVW